MNGYGDCFKFSMVQIHNDGKQKHNSFEGSIVDEYGIKIVWAHGETEAEVIEDLKEFVAKTIAELQAIDFSKITYVDWRGTPIERKT